MYACVYARNRLDVEGRFVTGSYDKQLISWHMLHCQPLSVVEGQRVTDLAVSADASRLVLITPDKKIKMYSLPDMALLPRSIPQVCSSPSAPPRSLLHVRLRPRPFVFGASARALFEALLCAVLLLAACDAVLHE